MAVATFPSSCFRMFKAELWFILLRNSKFSSHGLIKTLTEKECSIKQQLLLPTMQME